MRAASDPMTSIGPTSRAVKLGLAELRRRLLELPTERAIAVGRLVLTCTALAAVLINHSGSQRGFEAALGIMLVYSVIAVVPALMIQAARSSELLTVFHVADVVTTTLLIYVSGDRGSIFFPLFIFSLIVGLLRWNWRGALATSGLIATAILFTPFQFRMTAAGPELLPSELSRAITQGGFIVVCGAMLAYLGAHRERDRRRFAQLANWPASLAVEKWSDALTPSLEHAAMILQAPRLLVLWEEHEEPGLNACLYAGGATACRTVEPDEELARLLDVKTGFHQARLEPRVSLPAALVTFYRIERAGFAGFSQDLTRGALLVLDRASWLEEDVPVLELMSARLGLEVEQHILRLRTEEVVGSRERMTVARDLHDGVLQSLAAANMQLKLLADDANPAAAERAQHLRTALTAEARRLRSFVEGTRSSSARGQAPDAPLGPLLAEWTRLLSAQWSCRVSGEADPPSLALSPGRCRHLELMIRECVSNAVRHGGATSVSVTVSRDGALLNCSVKDNGSGMALAQASQLTSLQSRVGELGGSVTVAPCPYGTELRLQIGLDHDG